LRPTINIKIVSNNFKKSGRLQPQEPPAYQGISHIKTYIGKISDDFRKKFGDLKGRPKKYEVVGDNAGEAL
jgi:hypothetical protein